jgi:subtilisin
VADDLKRVLITFKPKDQRPDREADKCDIVRAAIESDVQFFSADDFSRGPAVPSAMAPEHIGYDVNRYGAPIVMAQLTDAEVGRLQANANIESVEEDQPAWALEAAPLIGTLAFEDQPSVLAETVPAGVSQVKAPPAWDASKGMAIKVAILDTGIQGNHPDLAANFRGGVTFVPDESTTNDYHGHGTHCAGTVAAAMNGQGVVGVAPAAYLYAVKVLNRYGSGQYSWIIAGIDWCVSKKRMNVISMSLGGGADVNALQKMCDTAYAEGVLIIAAAGNSGPPPAGQPSSVGYPARYDSVVAVSAIGSDNVIAGFSSRGPEVELCAPGVQVLSTYPVNNYHKMSGTSMACPHVAGVAAMAWGSHRFQNNRTIRTLLQQSADNLGNPGRDPLYGFGRVDAWQATLTMSMP